MLPLVLLLAPALQGDAAPLQGSPAERLDADALVEEAWRFLPRYDGDRHELLTADARRETAAGAHLLEAALALAPDHLRALWSLGHARVRLADDAETRGRPAEAAAGRARAIEALGHAVELGPSDPWALLARAGALTSAGRHAHALADLERARDAAERRIAAGEEDSLAWLRFKALELLPEVQVRLGDFEAAREALRSFHGEFSSNAWPLHVALAESFARERDLAGARASYEDARREFDSDHQAWALLGYLAGLLGDRAEATARLQGALERELQPGLYTRLWLWLLATDDARPAAEEDLRGFLEHPPGSVSAWDLQLGRFALGLVPVETFREQVRAEEARRRAAAEPLDDLACEAWFYVGAVLERQALAASDPADRDALRRRALEAHGEALAFDPPRWKWEWAFARVAYADLAEALGLEDDSVEALPLAGVRWHAPRAERPVADLGREPRPGDLALAVVDRGEAGPAAVRVVVRVR